MERLVQVNFGICLATSPNPKLAFDHICFAVSKVVMSYVGYELNHGIL
jgi:hypothetical protein